MIHVFENFVVMECLIDFWAFQAISHLQYVG